MSEVVAEIDLTQWRDMLQKIESKAAKVNDILKAVFNVYGFADIQKHFREESGPEGKWKSRSPWTQAFYDAIASGKRKPPKGTPRAAYRSSNKLLQLTGKLRNSILNTNIKNVRKGAIEVFSSSEYSKKHDEGDPSSKIPKRSFMWMSNDTLTNMAEKSVSFWLSKDAI